MTDKWLARLKPKPGERLEFADAVVPGLRLRVGARKKMWSTFTTIDGERTRITLGSYPEISLSAARRMVGDGGAVRAAAESGTVGELVEMKLRTLEADGATLEHIRVSRHYLERFARFVGPDRPANEIEPEDIVEWLRGIAVTGISTFHPRAAVSAAFATAMKSDYDPRSLAGVRFRLKANPVTPVASDRINPRNRVLSFDELKVVWNILNDTPGTFATALQLMIAMGGLRVTEILHSRWGWWLEEHGWLHIPKTKNGTTHSVPLAAVGETILDGWRKEFGCPDEGYVFPDSSHRNPVSIPTFAHQVAKFYKTHNLEPFQARDIRRTMKTQLIDHYPELNRDWIDVWHNHGQASDVARKHYDRSKYEKAKRAVADAIDDLVRNL